MKLVKKTLLSQLQTRADAFDAIVDSVVKSSEGATPEDITAETIIEALQANTDDAALTEAQNKLTKTQDLLTAKQTALQTANDRITELETEVKTLEKLPGDNPAGISSKGEPDGEAMTLAQFADKNVGDTQAILAMAVKDGLI